MAKITTFTPAHKELHKQVVSLFEKGSTGRKRVGHVGGVKRYSPETDIFILELFNTDGYAEKYGAADTNVQHEMCEQIAEKLMAKFGDERSADSIYYRIRKLMRTEDLASIDYRHENKSRKLKAAAAE